MRWSEADAARAWTAVSNRPQYDPRDPARGDKPRPSFAALSCPRWWTRQATRTTGAGQAKPRNLTRGIMFWSVYCGRVTRLGAVRGRVTRTEAIRGRCRNWLDHLFFGSNPGLLGWPGSSFKHYKHLQDLFWGSISFFSQEHCLLCKKAWIFIS